MPTWNEITAANPQHSENYAARWDRLAAAGHDINGEARFIDAIAPRGARILDAGCGTGRVGGVLARRGHTVVGTDVDPILIDHARANFPDCRWLVGDLCTDPIPEDNFDVVVSAGNVMGFLAVEGRRPALENISRALAPNGRAVIGFGRGRGWAFDDFFADAESAGLVPSLKLESWDARPLTAESNFLVAILEHRR